MKTNFFRKFFVAVALCCSPVLSFAEWVPEECLEDLDPSEFAVLADSNYRELKERVKRSLEGSWCSSEKLNLMMDLVRLTKPKVCVEIGAFTGSSVLPVAATLKYLNQGEVYAIDAWSNEEVTRHLHENDLNKSWWNSVDMNYVRRLYDELMESYGVRDFCRTIHSSSENAVNQIPEIDFLHLDGDYSEVGSLRDVELYLPKVKSGGYVLFSNLFLMIGGKQPKLKSFSATFDSCDMICSIERDNAILFRKY